MKLEIRPFENKDVAEVAQVHHDSYHFVSQSYRPELMPYYPLEKFQDNWQAFAKDSHGKKALLAVDGKKIVGLVRYSPNVQIDTKDWTWKKDQKYINYVNYALAHEICGQLHQFYVLPEWTRKNIGSELCASALIRMRNTAIYAMVERNIKNTLSEHFQATRLKSEDIATFTDHDLTKGEYGAPNDVTSTSVMAMLLIDETLKNLVAYVTVERSRVK